MSHFLEGKKIIVAGSGFAGLAFVVTLRQRWDNALEFPDIVIYDRDSRELSQKREGYSLSVNGMEKDSGLIAMRDVGLLDEALKHAVTGADSVRSFRMWDKDWNALMAMNFKPYDGLPTAGIRIARKDLRNMLLEAGESSDKIVWDTICTSAERLDSGRIRIHLSHGDETSTDECDLLIAADGAHSKIRASVRPEDGLIYEGVTQMGGIGVFPDGIPKPVDESWGVAVSGQGVSCFMSPIDKQRVVWALSQEEAEPRPKLDNTSAEQTAAFMDEAKRIGHMMGGPFPAVLAATDPNSAFVLPARDKQPFSHETVPSGIVFIGDSNHAVSPFAGNGANLALKDGWDLATQLCGSKTLEEAVSAYDKLAVPRAVRTVKSSHNRMGIAHCTGVKYTLLRGAFGVGSWFMWMAGKS
ncbi:putative monooxygenase [Thelonectria olida]|uniref:Monooxygenase n=1 Tax=Thelonectria olida TaxID=1576542 RepID=A0A9P8VXG2_9HYPO|nr:putative monooxygenase [Thelonectria olida]